MNNYEHDYLNESLSNICKVQFNINNVQKTYGDVGQYCSCDSICMLQLTGEALSF